MTLMGSSVEWELLILQQKEKTTDMREETIGKEVK